MRNVTVAATQMVCEDDLDANIGRAELLVEQAANKGANIVLLQELFHAPYFCKEQTTKHFAMAKPFKNNPLIEHFQQISRKHNVVLPLSFFELEGNRQFNSLAMIDADGSTLGLYRKSHIPDGPGYQEKFYFSPGNTGFKVWDTRFGRIGAGICWDQWFPESARSMALLGAEILMYPTAIGSEPPTPEYDSSAHWQNVMCGHAGANLMPLLASNRIGTETADNGTQVTFYGCSFISDWCGNKVAVADRQSETVLTSSFDLDEIAETRRAWGVFRDRRPELYSALVE
ncbi:MAG: N-carbamoylputrescine amidase [Parasphingorhabdus sp.]